MTPLCYFHMQLSIAYKAPSSRRTPKIVALPARLEIIASLFLCFLLISFVSAQTRRRPRPTQPQPQTQAPRGSATKYSTFLHSSDKHKSLKCSDCHRVPTAWNAKRDFPDVADFPDHDACVRCHRQQFFTRQVIVGTGPSICTVCHVRAAPRENARFAFGAPNNSNQPTKPKQQWQFTNEFPHDKHQNAIAMLHRLRSVFSNHKLTDDKKPDYNNCSICHKTDDTPTLARVLPQPVPLPRPENYFKTMPHSHDACFDCHWKDLKPVSDDCGGCHKLAPAAFAPMTSPKRISAKFAHEGGKGEHILECTTCHINITRASTSRGLTPDVPIAACASCHKDSKKTTYPKAATIEEEFANNKKTGECTYCHTADVGKKKPPPSHDAAAQ